MHCDKMKLHHLWLIPLNWFLRFQRNRAVMSRVRAYEKWSRHAARDGHGMFKAHYAEMADRERENLIP